MKIEHIAIWTRDLEVSRAFYANYFGAVSGQKYVNSQKGFSSYFLTFAEGCRLEIMHMDDVESNWTTGSEVFFGISHFAVSVGSKALVDALTGQIGDAGFDILSAPRHTGDGYYESVVSDPDGNRIEITQ